MRVLATFTAAYALAVLAAVYGGQSRFLFALGVLFAGAAVAAGLGKRWGRGRLRVVLVCMGLSAGFLWTLCYQNIFLLPAQRLDGRTISMEAVVKGWPEESNGGWSVLVSAEVGTRTAVDALLYVDEQGADLRPGDRISTVVRCRQAGETFSGEDITYYTAKGVFLRGVAYGSLTVDRPEKLPLTALPAHLARALEGSIRRAFPGSSGETVVAIVTGNRARLTQTFTAYLQRTGLSHAAAVSGMHLAFLVGMFAALLGPCRPRTTLVVIPVTLVFMLAAGCTPSVVRATVMAVLLMLAPLVREERDDVTSLAAALLILLVYNPLSVTHVGLQLSFGAVAGIFLIAKPIEHCLERKLDQRWVWKGAKGRGLWWIKNYCISTLSATLGASVFTIPLCALHFSSLSLISPLSNLLTLWAVALVFAGGFVIGVLGLFLPGAAAVLAGLVAWAAEYLEWVVEGISLLPFASLTMDSFSYQIWTILLSFVILFLLVGKGRRHLAAAGLLTLSTLLVAALFAGLEFYAGPMSITALNVGQGQSILLRQGNHLTLVDCGGSAYDNAGDLAANAIQDIGRRSLDTLVLTHLHQDHANGVLQLFGRLQVKRLILPELGQDSELGTEILEAARRQGCEVLTIRENAVVPLSEDSRLSILAPVGRKSENELGLTVLAATGAFDVLITGDLSGRSEQALMKRNDLPDVELLVAGHHGAGDSTSARLLGEVTPEVVLISVGEHNTYGHPSAETLDRLSGLEVYRTDRDGTVSITVTRQGCRLL